MTGRTLGRGTALAAAAVAGALALAGCGSHAAAKKTGLSGDDRKAAQVALDTLQKSNISDQLIAITQLVQNRPAACRVRVVSLSPRRVQVYVFWIPWLAAEPYVWLNMDLPSDPHKGSYHVGTAEPILPGGRLNPDGQTINRGSVDTTLLTRSGPEQAKKSQEMLREHGSDVFSQPSGSCQLLKSGSLRLLPDA